MVYSREHTHRLFIKLRVIKLKGKVEFKSLLVMLTAKNRLLPEYLQKLFVLRSADDDNRRKFHFKTQSAGNTVN